MAAPESTAQSKGPFVLSILIIILGVGWLLSARGVGLGVNWIWTLGLGAVGILTFVLSGGFDKFSIVIGPFFLACSLLSILRQSGRLSFDTELPTLVILIGVLLLIAQMRFVPPPRWFAPLEPPKR
ncbi:MAG: hypothetical protein QM775_08300 [Pirellulales bacterium]